MRRRAEIVEGILTTMSLTGLMMLVFLTANSVYGG